MVVSFAMIMFSVRRVLSRAGWVFFKSPNEGWSGLSCPSPRPDRKHKGGIGAAMQPRLPRHTQSSNSWRGLIPTVCALAKEVVS